MYEVWFFILLAVYCNSLNQTDTFTTENESQNGEEINLIQKTIINTADLGNGTETPVPVKITSLDKTFTTIYKEDVILPCSYVGSPTPTVTWTNKGVIFSRNTTERVRHLPNGSLIIHNPTRVDAGHYSCKVENKFGQDSKTYQLIVKVPPKAPTVQMVSTTNNSLTIKLKPNDNDGEPIHGYTIYYKVEFGDWNTVQIGAEREFTIEQLLCGSRYHLYVTAFNNFGQGDPSENYVLTTKGTKPIIPSADKLIELSSTSIKLHLNAWSDGVCRLLNFEIELKKKTSTEWMVVSNHVRPGGIFLLQDLDSGYWYQLRVFALNDAGFTVGEYEFATLTVT